MYTVGTFVPGAYHPQVDTKKGFTCDEELLPFVEALYSTGFRTCGPSCQNTNRQYVIQRRVLGYEHDDPFVLLKMALYLRDKIHGDSWGQEMSIDHSWEPSRITVGMSWTKNLDKKVLKAITSYLTRSR
jgi:hypothetical protein